MKCLKCNKETKTYISGNTFRNIPCCVTCHNNAHKYAEEECKKDNIPYDKKTVFLHENLLKDLYK